MWRDEASQHNPDNQQTEIILFVVSSAKIAFSHQEEDATAPVLLWTNQDQHPLHSSCRQTTPQPHKLHKFSSWEGPWLPKIQRSVTAWRNYPPSPCHSSPAQNFHSSHHRGVFRKVTRFHFKIKIKTSPALQHQWKIFSGNTWLFPIFQLNNKI